MLELFFENGLMEHIPVTLKTGYQRPGAYLVNLDPKAYASEFRYLEFYRKLNLDHKYVILNRRDTPEGKVVEYFTFAAPKNDFNSNYFYLNHHEVLQEFTNEFIKNLVFGHIPLASGPNTSEMIDTKTLFGNIFDEMPSLYTTRKVLQRTEHLTKREYDIIRLLIEGKNTKETAEILCLSTRTVENHFQNMRKKYQCKSKAQLLQRLSYGQNLTA